MGGGGGGEQEKDTQQGGKKKTRFFRTSSKAREGIKHPIVVKRQKKERKTDRQTGERTDSNIETQDNFLRNFTCARQAMGESRVQSNPSRGIFPQRQKKKKKKRLDVQNELQPLPYAPPDRPALPSSTRQENSLASGRK